MIERLGNVVYWTGSGIAVLFLFLTALHLVSKQGDLFLTILFAVVAVVAWLIGWALRYVLAGTT
jgi:hypothetical protein